jgi:diguanylate cyclase (GGDEF)-like protein
MSGRELLQSGIIVFSVNLIGATFCYRYQLLQRRSFLKLMHERNTREALQTQIAQRTKMEEKLLYQAHTDELTGTHNRRHFLQLGRDEISRSLRYDRPLSLLLLDLDHFKAINDRFGHDTGDEVLRRFSRLCRRTLREPDILGRLGGEEFAIIIPEESLQGAIPTAERLRAAVENEFIDTPYGLTISIGVTEIKEDDTSISELLKRADAMMYEAKHRGRNQVIANPSSAVKTKSN